MFYFERLYKKCGWWIIKETSKAARKGITSRLTKSCCYSIYNKPLLLSLYKSHAFPLALEKYIGIKEIKYIQIYEDWIYLFPLKYYDLIFAYFMLLRLSFMFVLGTVWFTLCILVFKELSGAKWKVLKWE